MSAFRVFFFLISNEKLTNGRSVSVATRECASCFESLQLYQGVQCSCDHYYCLTCVRNVVNASLSDNSFALFPPKCCNKPLMGVHAQGHDVGGGAADVMQIELLGVVLDDAELKTKLDSKWKEWSTKGEDRVYCCAVGCGRFVGSAAEFEAMEAIATASAGGSRSPTKTLRRVFSGRKPSGSRTVPAMARCTACSGWTCVSCRQEGHAGKTCTDVGDSLFWETTRVRGWNKCPGCSAVIEKNGGCAHVVCRCGRSFNYA